MGDRVLLDVTSHTTPGVTDKSPIVPESEQRWRPTRWHRQHDDRHDHATERDDEQCRGQDLEHGRTHGQRIRRGLDLGRRRAPRSDDWSDGRCGGDSQHGGQAEHDQQRYQTGQDDRAQKRHGRANSAHRSCDGQAVGSVTNGWLARQPTVTGWESELSWGSESGLRWPGRAGAAGRTGRPRAAP